MYGSIYKIKNKTNGKSYVGQSTNPSRRRRSHFEGRGYQSSPILRKAMLKYGKDNFIFQIIATACSKEELDRKEIYWIKELNTMLPTGYNIRGGGARGLLSEESKKKISQANKGRFAGKNNPCYGLKGSKHPMYGRVGPNTGKKLSDEQKQLLSERITGMKRSKKTKERSKISALRRWERGREKHMLEKGHEYDLVELSTGSVRCSICHSRASKRSYKKLVEENS